MIFVSTIHVLNTGLLTVIRILHCTGTHTREIDTGTQVRTQDIGHANGQKQHQTGARSPCDVRAKNLI